MPRVALLMVAAIAGCAHARTRPARPGVDEFVRLERTECLGECPVYSVTLFADGEVMYEGERYALPGRRWRRIDPAEVRRLGDEALRLPHWELHLECFSTDHPEAIITVSRGGRARRIVHDHGDTCVPDEVWWVEGQIDVAGGHPQY